MDVGKHRPTDTKQQAKTIKQKLRISPKRTGRSPKKKKKKKGQQLCRWAPNFSEAKTELGSPWNEITGMMRENCVQKSYHQRKRIGHSFGRKHKSWAPTFPHKPIPKRHTSPHRKMIPWRKPEMQESTKNMHSRKSNGVCKIQCLTFRDNIKDQSKNTSNRENNGTSICWPQRRTKSIRTKSINLQFMK